MPENYVIDEDTTDAFLDLPVSRYAPGGKTIPEIDAAREEAGLDPIEAKPMKLPPLTKD